jgi:hypothetical protein
MAAAHGSPASGRRGTWTCGLGFSGAEAGREFESGDSAIFGSASSCSLQI